MTDLTPEALAEWRKDAEDHIFNSAEATRRILALLDALAAEKAAREEAEQAFVEMNNIAIANSDRAVKAEQDSERWKRKFHEEANACAKAEGTVEFLLGQKDEWTAAIAKAEQERDALRGALDSCSCYTGRAEAAEARVAALEAGINALADEAAFVVALNNYVVSAEALRALTEKGADVNSTEACCGHTTSSRPRRRSGTTQC